MEKMKSPSDENYWQNCLRQRWGLDAELTPLAGEFDLNFLAKSTNGKHHIVKIMRANCPKWLVDVQIRALKHILVKAPNAPVPRILNSLTSSNAETVHDQNGKDRLMWVIDHLPGQCYAESSVKTETLAHQLGQVLATTAMALRDFHDDHLKRDFKWDLMQGDWIIDHLDAVRDDDRRKLISDILAEFTRRKAALNTLDMQVVHNDANDYNILVKGTLSEPREISGLIDFGDMCIAPRVCDLAIAAAYIVLDHPKPEQMLIALVAGYHMISELTPKEVDLIWPLLRMRLAVSLVNSTMMAFEKPDDPYVTISQEPAWRFLEEVQINAKMITARLRAACDLPVVEGADRVMAWLEARRGDFAPLIGRDLSDIPACSLSVEEVASPLNPFSLPAEEAAELGAKYSRAYPMWLGYYNEPRLIYTAPAFRLGPWKASDRRTVHLAVDIFAPSGTPLYAPMEGVVVSAEYRPDTLDYGGVIMLEHETPAGDRFYTLYGHLDPAFIQTLKLGQNVPKGSAFCSLGSQDCNGGWPPHVHFQLILDTVGMGSDLPGVGAPEDMAFWHRLCPNPATLLNLPDTKVHYEPSEKSDVLAKRKSHFGGNLSISYKDPVMLVRGWRHHLFDEWGRPYLDAYNNVPHVGHAHPRLAEIAVDQMRRVNTNTRYIHKVQTEFAETLLNKFPKEFEVCYFVNSGSEANELALRLARAHSKQMGMITPDHGYFGNTTGALQISAYKFNKPNGIGQSDWVELVDVADDYRGAFRRDDPDRAIKYADLIDGAVSRLLAKGLGIGGFIAETFPSVGGQIIPPKGYLQRVYEKIRACGGVCIADEVQTGLGRLGSYYFGFEYQEALPDIVVLGKPIGNGHPIGAVVTTRAIADSFDNGIEYFSTFGGSTLSCQIGKAVLDIVDDEGLQQNAHKMGNRLLDGLHHLQNIYPAIGDVRGMGLFIGVELIHPDGSEATELCAYIKNRMRDHRILMGSEGPKDNILKIRPPLTIEADDVDMILHTMKNILGEI
jgi:4-aminobutyrate aminotransferase-like enzyme/Ser/Thr protein kinase RdoA (MazF antagonist)